MDLSKPEGNITWIDNENGEEFTTLVLNDAGSTSKGGRCKTAMRSPMS